MSILKSILAFLGLALRRDLAVEACLRKTVERQFEELHRATKVVVDSERRKVMPPVEIEFTVLPVYSYKDANYLSELERISRIPEFRFFMFSLEKEISLHLANGEGNLAHKSGTLFGVRHVMRRLEYATCMLEKTKEGEQE